MKTFARPIVWLLTGFAVLLTAWSPASAAGELHKLSNCSLVDSPANDGDSFLVKTGTEQLHVRLYFVDCPETVVTTDADAKRIREQARHFGLTDTKKIVAFGKEATAFTREALRQPFTVHTVYADAMGRSRGGRVYAFVTTHDGKDLATLLVENGWARSHGARRSTPDGRDSAEEQKRLTDLEVGAMLKRAGIWAATDPNEIARLRELQRIEDQEVHELRKQLSGAASESNPVNVNTASAAELQSISGIGPTLATAIIKARPYKTVDDLIRVKGIGPKLLEKIRPFVTVTASPPSEDAP